MSLCTYNNYRQLIRLKGPLSWCYQQCEYLIEQLEIPYFWLGDSPQKITSTLYKQILGQEISLLIINAHQDFDANQFAASEGTLRGGGVLILISPTEINPKNRFYHYIDKQLSKFAFTTITENASLPSLQVSAQQEQIPLHLEQQQLAIEAIMKTATGHRRRPLVLTANRGRGKSAALGIAAKRLTDSGLQKILVCAPNKSAVATLFKHAGKSEKIAFIAPDLLLASKPECELLLVDEAAALPVPLLTSLTKHYPRLVFSTTLHGYEGSGRGFALRFQSQLKKMAPQTRFLHLDQPIRWDKGDPLEQFTLGKLCLTDDQQTNPIYDTTKAVQFQQITSAQLLAEPSLLKQIFSLLVIAHYQTKPSELEQLLNDTHLSIFVLKQQEQLLSVALVNHEGGLDKQLSMQVYLGKRRLQGHLVAQSLTFHSAQSEAAMQRFARIQRIATHPSLQKLGLGNHLIKEIMNWATQQDFDHLCASFGATKQLLPFWQNNHFHTLRIGNSRDKSSGTHSFIVNLPLSGSAKQLHKMVSQQFHQQLAIQLTRQLHQLDAQLIASLLKERPIKQLDLPLVKSYCAGHLPYEFAESELISFIINSDLSILDKNQQTLTIQKILQNRSWAEVCQQGNYTGKKQAQQTLRINIQQVLSTQNLPTINIEEQNAPR